MIQDPNPTDDPEMERFCEWLYTEGYANQMVFDNLKNVWLRGLCDYYGERLSESGNLSGTEYELLMHLYGKAYNALLAHKTAMLPVSNGRKAGRGAGLSAEAQESEHLLEQQKQTKKDLASPEGKST